MLLVLLIARLALAAVFIVSGLAKITDLAGSRKAMREFGLPNALAAPLGALLPLVELAVAVALLAGGVVAWAGAVGSLALLLLFIAGMAVNLLRGRHPDCHCFGQLDSEPIGAKTLIRNGVLAAVAAFVAVTGYLNATNAGANAVGWFGVLTPFEKVATLVGLAALGLLAAEAYVLLQLLQQNGRLLLRLDTLQTQITDIGGAPATAMALPAAAPAAGLPVGTLAPAFSLTGLFGERLTLDSLRSSGRPLLLTFTDPNCGPCQALLPDLARWQHELTATVTLALISRGGADENLTKMREHGLALVLLQDDREVMEAYQATGTPSMVLVRPDGMVGSTLAQGAEEIRALVARSVSGNFAALPMMPYPPPAAVNGDGRCPHCGQMHDQQPATPAMSQGLPIGTPAPALRLPDLAGQIIDLADYRGRETALLFWNPGCGFCQQLLPQLKEWESNHLADAPALVIVSTGGIAANQAHGLMSTIVLDDNFSTGLAFGATGTPSAVKVGKDGAIASAVGVGGPSVMALLTNQPLAEPAAEANVPAAPAVKIGDAAPAFSLPDLDGKSVSLADRRGKRTLLLFWNPGCGFCQQMLQDLRQWEVQRPSDAPEILVISTGAAQENRILGLRSPIVLDAAMSVGQQVGAMGTPMGVLVDAEGRIASEVVAGAEAVLALARGGTSKS